MMEKRERDLKLALLAQSLLNVLSKAGFASENDHLDACVVMMACTLTRIEKGNHRYIMKEFAKRATAGADQVSRADEAIDKAFSGRAN